MFQAGNRHVRQLLPPPACSWNLWRRTGAHPCPLQWRQTPPPESTFGVPSSGHGAFLKWGTPQIIYFGFSTINHPTIGVPIYGNRMSALGSHVCTLRVIGTFRRWGALASRTKRSWSSYARTGAPRTEGVRQKRAVSVVKASFRGDDKACPITAYMYVYTSKWINNNWINKWIDN